MCAAFQDGRYPCSTRLSHLLRSGCSSSVSVVVIGTEKGLRRGGWVGDPPTALSTLGRVCRVWSPVVPPVARLSARPDDRPPASHPPPPLAGAPVVPRGSEPRRNTSGRSRVGQVNHYDRGMAAFDALFVPARLRAAVSSHAWLEGMLDAERALATAGAAAGVVPAGAAAEIAAACDAARFDPDLLAEEGRAAGNPAEPLVRPSRARSATKPRVGSTAARRARTSSTPRRCSSRSGR